MAGTELVGAEARERAVDDGLRQVGRPDAEPLRHSGPEALEHDVCPRAQFAARLWIGLQVAGHGLLAGVQRLVPGRRELSQRIPSGRLKPHDAGAEPEQLAAREGAGKVPRQVDYEQAREGFHRQRNY